jgi:phenylpropionate dioxygenase-like ring-hydroxylating dioxygenase large terminal subunit
MGERFPLPIPNGWFQIAYSDELAPGRVQPLHYFGKDLMLSRAQSGEITLVEPDVSPPWHCCERNEIIWAWHHGAGRRPEWEIPEVAEITSDDWTPLRRHRWTVRTHNQEIGENAVDRAHFRFVHGTADVPESELHLDGHIRRAVQHVTMRTPRGEVDGQIRVEAHGMGCTITRFTGICETVLLLSHTPIDRGTVDSRFSFTQRKADAESRVAAAVIQEVVRQMDQDIPIWEHKKYLAKPMLCDGDGPIHEYRKWASQFYC